MLGLARHAQLAGWGTIPPGLKDTITFTTAASNGVYPRYYADFTNMTNRPTYGVVRQSYVDSSATIDMTGVTNNYKKAVMACTFKLGTNWLSTSWSMGDYQGGFTDYHEFNGVNTGPRITGDWNYASGVNAMSYQVWTGSFQIIQITPATFATYRNKWLTIISATSDSTSDFANWTGTGTNTYGHCERLYLVEADTGVILQQKDSYATVNNFTPDLSQSWQLNTGSYNYGQYFYLYSEDGTNFQNDNNDMEHLSSWAAFGQTFDPATYYTELLGVGIADTVAGVQAWTNLYYPSEGTEPNSYTRRLILSNGDRLPTVRVDLLTNSTTPGVKPVWTLLSNNQVTLSPTIYYETFTSNGSWTASANLAGPVSAMIVAGGGGGGLQGSTFGGGGGGAGGIYINQDVTSNVTAGSTYTIVVGTGGAVQGTGNNSSAFGYTAGGGGAGGTNGAGGAGGSGGGGAGTSAAGGAATGFGAGTAGDASGGAAGQGGGQVLLPSDYGWPNDLLTDAGFATALLTRLGQVNGGTTARGAGSGGSGEKTFAAGGGGQTAGTNGIVIIKYRLKA